jgi:hypothetical protein
MLKEAIQKMQPKYWQMWTWCGLVEKNSVCRVENGGVKKCMVFVTTMLYYAMSLL